LEYFFNKKAYESLPKDLQHMLDAICMENELWVLSQFEARNGAALQELITKHNVELIQFPEEVLNTLRKMSLEVVEEEAKKTPLATKVNDSFKAFQKVAGAWGTVSEKAYYDIISPQEPA
jgi:TRAP-type mannitol/chloroaromatic compound transport system substrate-binding protein